MNFQFYSMPAHFFQDYIMQYCYKKVQNGNANKFWYMAHAKKWNFQTNLYRLSKFTIKVLKKFELVLFYFFFSQNHLAKKELTTINPFMTEAVVI